MWATLVFIISSGISVMPYNLVHIHQHVDRLTVRLFFYLELSLIFFICNSQEPDVWSICSKALSSLHGKLLDINQFVLSNSFYNKVITKSVSVINGRAYCWKSYIIQRCFCWEMLSTGILCSSIFSWLSKDGKILLHSKYYRWIGYSLYYNSYKNFANCFERMQLFQQMQCLYLG